MATKNLCLASLGEIDRGAAGMAIDHAIRQAVDDTIDRGKEDGKPRKVVITLELTSNPQGDLFHATVKVAYKTPELVTNATQAELRYSSVNGERKNTLVFQQGSNRADQPTLPIEEVES